MRDALGGTVSLFIISVFIVLALGYLAFNVNYTKAFRMKDKIISVYEKNEGCREYSKCQKEIDDYARSIGYMPDNISCGDDFSNVSGNGGKLFCVKGRLVNKPSGGVFDQKPKCSYKVVTKINISIPIIDSLLDIDVFKVKGDTKAIEVLSGSVNDDTDDGFCKSSGETD